MGTTKQQRQEIETLEDFAARLDDMDESQRLLALRTRNPDSLREIARTRQHIAAMQREIWAWREAVHKQAGGPTADETTTV